ncbi:MAG: hypothetical protein ACFFBR_07065 [Promethearchaeota archaeon]
MALHSQSLTQRFHQKQERLREELEIEPLPRHKDRILMLTWGDIPLHYDRPRFGALEIQRADRSRGSWAVTLAQALQNKATPILDWVLWREALLNFLLPHLRHISEAADLGLYAGLQYGDYTDANREMLIALWKQVSPPQHYRHYIYDGPFGFPLFDQVVTGTFLHRVITWLNTLRPPTTGISLATPTYTAALERWMLETHIPLTPPEHHILSALSQLTTHLHQSRLADQLNMSISGLSQHLSNLAKRHLLRLNHFINLPLIGLTPFELIIQTPDTKTLQRISSLFSEIQFTWFINTFQKTNLHCRVIVPAKHEKEFKDWLLALSNSQEILPIVPLRTNEIIRSWNFEIYVPDSGWPQDFTLQYYQIRSAINHQTEIDTSALSISSMSYELLETNQDYPISLRPEDFTYFLRAADIHQLTDRITSPVSEEIRQAGISETAHMIYRRRIRQLEKMNVSHLQGLVLLHIGLDTAIQLYVKETKSITILLAKALSVLPNMRALIFENGNGLIVLFIPNHSAVETLSILRETFVKNEINVNIEVKPTWQTASGFESPISHQNYDFKKREWKWERTFLPELDSS